MFFQMTRTEGSDVNRAFLFSIIATVAACASSTGPTRIAVEVSYDANFAPSELEIALGSGSAAKTRKVGVAARVTLLVSDSLAGTAQNLSVLGFRGAARIATGRAQVTPKLGEEVVVRVTLARVACGDWCVAGATECRSTGTGPGATTSVVVCEQRDEDSCMEWGDPIACAGTLSQCALGTCVAMCANECAEGDVQCAGGEGLRRCGQADSDSCFEWLPAIACNGSERCSSGACRATCEHECVDGAARCVGGGRSECGDRDGDGCREWSPTIPCGATEACAAGVTGGLTTAACMTRPATCSDECTESVCDGMTFRQCGNFDLDSCRELSNGVSCVPADGCLEGMCRVTGCATTAKRCSEPPGATCTNATTLKTFDSVGLCSSGACAYNSTDRTCANGCEAGRCKDMPDPCAGVTCQSPPSVCYAAGGTCANGSCSYAFANGTRCEDNDMCTENDTCNAGLCRGSAISCATPPAAMCRDASTLRTFAAIGSCSANTCAYAPQDTVCANGCVAGACTVAPAGGLAQTAYLKASANHAHARLGASIAMSGDGTTIAVGAPNEDPADEIDGRGAVYVFRKSATAWVAEARLVAAQRDPNDGFGAVVALSADGSTLLVGAHGEGSNATGINGNAADNSARSSGAAYVFRRTGTSWTQEAYVKASNTRANAAFGNAVALSADGLTFAVGSVAESGASRNVNGSQVTGLAPYAGAVYVFRRTGPAWAQDAYVKASNAERDDAFGGSVALSADGLSLVVGASGERSNATGVDGNQVNNSVLNAGAAYMFVRTDAWRQTAYVKASNTGTQDSFGARVGISADGTTFAVSAVGESSNAVGIDGDQTNNSAGRSGAVYVFGRAATTWQQVAYIKPTNAGSGWTTDVEFGSDLALSADGRTLVVGARSESSNATGLSGTQTNRSVEASGALYVFRRSASVYVKASNPAIFDFFGTSVGVSSDGASFVAGAPNEDSAARAVNGAQDDNASENSGAAYVFETLVGS